MFGQIKTCSIFALAKARALSSVGSEHPDFIGRVGTREIEILIENIRAISSVGSAHPDFIGRVGHKLKY